MEQFVQNNPASYIHRFLFTHLTTYKKIVDQLIAQPPRQVEGYSPIYRLAYIINVANDTNATQTMTELKAMMKQIQLGTVSLTSKQFDEFLLKYSSEEKEPIDESSEEVIYF